MQNVINAPLEKLSEYLKANGKENDEYLWKREAAEVLGKSEKSLERYAQQGKMQQVEKDRKIYYKVSDLLKLEADFSVAVVKPVLERPMPRHIEPAIMRQTQTEALALPNQLLSFLQNLENKLESIQPSNANTSLAILTGKRRIDADEFAETLGMQKAKVKAAIKRAEDSGELNRYAGLRNKAVYNCEDLDVIAEKLLAEEKPMERKTPSFGKKKKAAKS